MTWKKVLTLDQIPEGERQVAKVDGQSILLIHHKGQIYATDSTCPHLRLPLQGGDITDDGGIVCPWHHSAFDLESGDVKAWSPWPPGVGRVLAAVSREKVLPTFPARIQDGEIWVDLE